jgi:protease IV
MRRFVVGLLATLGFLSLLAIAGGAVFLYIGPFAAKPLPRSMVISLDLRNVPSETVSTDVLRGDLWRGARDIADVVQVLWQAAEDPRVVGLYVEIGDEDAGLARVQELRQAIARFRGKGKFAIGFAESLGGGDHFADFYLAAALDQIWLQPSGGFAVTGLSVETPFLKGGLDRLGIHMEGGKRYEYKSAPDTFGETAMTAPARENLQQLIDGLYAQFIEDVARDRRLASPRLRQLIDAAPFDSERAHQEGLVDRIGYRADAMNEVQRRAASTQDVVTLSDYAGDRSSTRPKGDVVALVRASGTIDSSSGGGGGLLDDDSGTSSDDVVDALDQAAQSKDVRAIVLRIDSPGGTYPAADAMADGVARARAAGKPVIVSMGDVAASGSYLAAVRADVIVAEPSTVTGSIGVFGMWPVASDLLAMLGVKVERVGVGANAGMYSTFKAPTADQRAAIARELDTVYADFTRQVADARKFDAAKIDSVARGRVFTGADALRAGLVDELGGLQLAFSIAKAKAGIDESRPIEIVRFPAGSDRWQRLLERAMKFAGLDARTARVRAPREVREALARVGVYSRPGTVRLPPLPPLWR